VIRLLIVDDHPIVRQGLKRIVADEPDITVGGEAENGSQALQMMDERDWDLVMLDVSMPGRGGLEVLKQLQLSHPHIPVLILSVYPEEQYAMRVVKAGAHGYLTKESAPEELVKAIREVVAGGRYISRSLSERLAARVSHSADLPLHERLSDREFQVFCMIASGKRLTRIAEDLFLSVKTISTHRTRILAKMSMNNNAELTHYAISHGLVELGSND